MPSSFRLWPDTRYLTGLSQATNPRTPGAILLLTHMLLAVLQLRLHILIHCLMLWSLTVEPNPGLNRQARGLLPCTGRLVVTWTINIQFPGMLGGFSYLLRISSYSMFGNSLHRTWGEFTDKVRKDLCLDRCPRAILDVILAELQSPLRYPSR